MRLQTARGATRFVIITRRRAYKLPRLLSWRHFLCGLLANMQEAQFGRTGWPELCPVLWSLPGGFLVVMPRAQICTPDDFPPEEEMTRLIIKDDYVVPAELKPDSWGWWNGRLVAIDYGS